MRTLPLETTPCQITAAIEGLCSKLARDQQPVFVPVLPVAETRLNECIENVQDYVASNSGELVAGWCIWERPNINLHAEYHTVWKSPDGELIDVSPKPDGETKILFLPDPKLVCEKGKRYPSELVALVNWREVQDYLNAERRLMDMHQPGMHRVNESECINTMMQAKGATKRLIKRIERQK